MAYNLRRARLERGWTQEETSVRLAPFTGQLWSTVNVSSIERSAAGGRRRRLDANDLVALAFTFELPPMWFLVPPPEAWVIRPGGEAGSGVAVRRYLELSFRSGWEQQIEERLAELGPMGGRGYAPARPDTTRTDLGKTPHEVERLEGGLRELIRLAERMLAELSLARGEGRSGEGGEGGG